MTTQTITTLAERANAARIEADNLTAAAAQLKTQLDTEQRALVARQRPFAEAATAAAARAALAAVDTPKVEPRPWVDALADPNVGLDGLFALWCEHRANHASRAAVVSAAGNALDSSDPRTGDDGQRLPWRRDTNDRMADALFLPAIEQAISIRTAAAAGAASQAVAQACNDAGAAAAAKIK
jgi:hypothetical protein